MESKPKYTSTPPKEDPEIIKHLEPQDLVEKDARGPKIVIELSDDEDDETIDSEMPSTSTTTNTEHSQAIRYPSSSQQRRRTSRTVSVDITDTDATSVTFLIGAAKHRFVVPLLVIRRYSKKFDKFLANPPPRVKETGTVRLPNGDPRIFAMFAFWLENPCLSNTEPPLTNLDVAKLWHFAKRYEIADLEGRCIVKLFTQLKADFSMSAPETISAQQLEMEKAFFDIVFSAGPTAKIAEMVTDYMIQAIFKGSGKHVMEWYVHMPLLMTGRILWRQTQIVNRAVERGGVPEAPPFDIRNYLLRTRE